MTDYIPREAVLEFVEPDARPFLAERIKSIPAADVVERASGIIGVIPAADVRPVVRGKWEDVNVRDYSTNINGGLPLNVASMCCSVCKRWHNEVYHYGNPTEMARFCPNCGADMREEQT